MVADLGRDVLIPALASVYVVVAVPVSDSWASP